MNDRDKRLLRLGELFPPMGKDKEVYDEANDEGKVRLIKKWLREKD